MVKERLRRTRRSGRMPVRRGQWLADELKPHVLEVESLYGIQCVGYQFAGQSGEERGNHRQRGPLASAQRGGLAGERCTAQHLNDAKDVPGAQIAHIPPSSNRRPIFNTPKSTLCLCACVCEKVRVRMANETTAPHQCTPCLGYHDASL